MIFNIKKKQIKINENLILCTVLDIKHKLNYITVKTNKTITSFFISNLINIVYEKKFFILTSINKAELNYYKNKLNKIELYTNIYTYTLKLEVYGIGYKILYLNNTLIFLLGYSHFIKLKIPNTIKIYVNSNKFIILQDINKAKLGNIMYIIKNLKKLNAYKAQGIKNMYEKINLKLGKSKLLKK